MAEPGDYSAAPASGRGGLRASHADREHVIEVLKDAFVQADWTTASSTPGQARRSHRGPMRNWPR